MTSSGASPRTPSGAGPSLRWLNPADLPAIATLLEANRPIFSDQECRVALELVEESLAKPDDPDPYQALVAEQDDGIVGYACFGAIPLTDGAYDLYWIAVHPAHQHRGIGRALLRRCEHEIVQQGGRLIAVETSGRDEYDATREFYTATGYEQTARIRDFYRIGDDKVMYVKYLGLFGEQAKC
jgi:ribosomal protein S18 acetylase RimI-like enzyme